jgi:Zn-dependent protease with chaperone function
MSGTYLLHGLTLALAWFAVANVVASASVAVAARWAFRDARPRAAGSWLAMRCLPAALSFAFVAALFVPSYLQFEPRETLEGFDVTLTLCAAASIAIVFSSSLRGLRAWRRSCQQVSLWMRGARPLPHVDRPLPIYTIGAAPAPLIALVGIRSPRVLVSDHLIAALTGSELDAALAHENSHARSRDNLKRLLMRLLPDALAGTAIARTIEQRWASAAEHAADGAATSGDAAARCALASALVKVARLMPSGSAALDPISTLVGGGDLSARVESLLAEPRAIVSPRRPVWIGAAAIAGAALAYAPLLHAVHELTEVLVNSLP